MARYQSRCRRMVRSASPASTSRPLAYSRTVSSRRKRASAAVGFGEDQRLLDESSEGVQDVHGVDRLAGAHRLRRLERRPAGEDREPAQDGPLRLGQQVVAPVDGGAQRLVPGEGRPAAAGQEAEAVVQPGRDLLHRQGAHPGGGQLDGQRHAVEAAAQLGHRAGVLVGHGERGLDGPGALDEQAARIDLVQVAGAHGRAGLRGGQRGDRQDGLARDAQRLAAGDHDAHGRAGPHHRLGQLRAFGQDGVAVVEQEEQAFALQVIHHGRQQRPAGRLRQAEDGHDGRQHEVRVGQRAALDEPHAVLEATEQQAGEAEAEAGLAHPTRTGQREQRRLLQDGRRLFDLALAADEAGDLQLQVVARRVGRARRREVAGEARRGHLVEADRRVEGAQPVGAQVDHADARAGFVGDQVARRAGDEDLAAVAGRADARRTVDIQPDVALGGRLRLTGVEAHPVPQRQPVRPRVGGQRELPFHGRLDGRPRGGEDEVQPVARRPAFERAVTGERATDQRVVVGQDRGVAVAERLEQARRTLDVGEDEGDGAFRQAGFAGWLANARLSRRRPPGHPAAGGSPGTPSTAPPRRRASRPAPRRSG